MIVPDDLISEGLLRHVCLENQCRNPSSFWWTWFQIASYCQHCWFVSRHHAVINEIQRLQVASRYGNTFHNSHFKVKNSQYWSGCLYTLEVLPSTNGANHRRHYRYRVSNWAQQFGFHDNYWTWYHYKVASWWSLKLQKSKMGLRDGTVTSVWISVWLTLERTWSLLLN